MPFTPFHFGPAACISLPLKRWLDTPAFLLVNVAIDIEPLLVMVFSLNYPVHGYAHTLIGATIIGLLCGWLLYARRSYITRIMNALRLDYQPTLKQALMSGVLGGWFHIYLDSQLYPEIKPFFPLTYNPFLGVIDDMRMYNFCAICFIPALAIYLYRARQFNSAAQN